MSSVNLSRECRCGHMSLTLDYNFKQCLAGETLSQCFGRRCSRLCDEMRPRARPPVPDDALNHLFHRRPLHAQPAVYVPVYYHQFSHLDPLQPDYFYNYRMDTTPHGSYAPFIGSWQSNLIGAPQANFGF